MSAKPITHSRWLRGLQAGFDRYSQPKGSVARVSNLVMTRRGAWKTCDGSQIITQYRGVLQAAFGPITEVFLFQPTGSGVGYFGIAKDLNTHIGSPAGFAAVIGASGVLAGVYKYVITALDGTGGESTASAEVTVTLSTQKGSLSWTALTNAAGGYNIYRTIAGGGTGSEKFVATVAGQSSSSYTDNTPDGSLGIQTPPLTDTTQVCQFYAFVAPSYSAANIVVTLPADAIPEGGGGTPGGTGGSGSGGGGTSGFQPPTPAGGTVGNLSPLPLIVQFINKMMLILGNGITPYESDGTTGGTTQITNSFSAAYPAYANSTAFNQGDQIQVTISAVTYVFTATQGGISATAGTPAFSAVLGSTVIDGSGSKVIWKNSGQVTGSPPPRGAAHAEIYAGSLWVANTSPQLSSDQLDGPSALRMSDLNNPLSWNPLNAAQISPDDGDQCTGIKAFTVAEAGIAPQNFLMYFKNYSTYLIQGVFGATDFAITRLQTDLGCIAARSLQFVPGYGIMRLSHLGFAVTDGISDKLQDPEAIRPYLFPESTESDITPIDQSYLYFAKAAQTANPPMYVCALPLQGLATSLFSSVTVANAFGPGGPLMAANTYYFRIQYTSTGGQTFTSGEYVINVPAPTGSGQTVQGIAINLPSNSTVASWKIFMGSAGTGSENKYITVSGGSSVVITNQGSNPTVFTNGKPVVGLGGYLTRLFCYDLVLKSWTVADVPYPVSVVKQFRTPGSLPITLLAGFNDGALRRWQAGDSAWDSGAINAGFPTTAVQWSFRDAEVFAEAGTVNLFYDQVIIRGDGGPSSISTSIQRNGKQQSNPTQASILALGNNQYEARIRILRTAANLNLTVSGSGPATVESIDYQVVEKPAGASLVIS